MRTGNLIRLSEKHPITENIQKINDLNFSEYSYNPQKNIAKRRFIQILMKY